MEAHNLDVDLIADHTMISPAFARVDVRERSTRKRLICFRYPRHPNGASQELVSWNPRGVPSLQSRVAKRAFEAGDLPLWSNCFGSAVDRAALAR
jgi:hypothetical protein